MEAGKNVMIDIEGIGRFDAPRGINLRDALRREGIIIDGTCADEGRCGRCIVRILCGFHGSPSASEKETVGKEALSKGDRLACRVILSEDLRIAVRPERVIDMDRSGRWKEAWDSPLWADRRWEPDMEGYGICIDMGTTSVVTALFDLSAGRPLDIKASLNPLMSWGSEVLSMLDFASSGQAEAKIVQAALWSTVSSHMRTLCLRNGIPGGSVGRIVAVGNSAMHHLALAIQPEPLLAPPYDSPEKEERILSPRDLPLDFVPEECAQIIFPPLVGGFAGSDALLSVLAAMKEGAGSGILIDAGTNSEIAVWDKHRVLVGTAAAGPAFEGGHVKHGMSAENGAIFRVEVGRDSVRTEVIGEGEPRGICGTGIIDAVAGMLEAGVLEPSGLIRTGSHPSLVDAGFLLGNGGGICIEPGDVESLQKAKAALAAVLAILTEKVGMGPQGPDRVFLCGAFGSRLNIASAKRIGLLPPLPDCSFISAGNSALIGASMVLLSNAAQEAAGLLAERIKHVSVAEEADYEELFLDNLYFPQYPVSDTEGTK